MGVLAVMTTMGGQFQSEQVALQDRLLRRKLPKPGTQADLAVGKRLRTGGQGRLPPLNISPNPKENPIVSQHHNNFGKGW